MAGFSTAVDNYAILSQFSSDLELNSYIKSPNKAVTTLVAGLIPIVSHTPNYRMLFKAHGLDRFIYASSVELDAILRRLDPVADARAIEQSGIVSSLWQDGAEPLLVVRFLAVLDSYLEWRHHHHQLAFAISPAADTTQRAIGLREHLADLFPSALRALKSRIGFVSKR